MKKTVYVIRDDIYHPKEIIDPALESVLDSHKWRVVRTDRVRDLLETEEPVHLVIFFTNGRPPGETDLSYAEQDQIVERVQSGMGIMFIHAGLVLIEPDSPFYLKLNSGRFISHSPDHVAVTSVPVRNLSHPVLKGITSFTVMDEHYYCQIETANTDLLLLSTSKYVTTAGAWAHSVGDGRVVGMIPGHTKEALSDIQFIRLLQNAAFWCVRDTASS